jgi:2-dehydro-3-deoxyphosphogluconate aldolase/(4S)-4-hydroxy-2-oxoglutarate aldolase
MTSVAADHPVEQHSTGPTLEKRLRAVGIVPVITIRSAHDATALGSALIRGGLPIAEITFRTPAAAHSIQLLRQNFPDFLVGAGTVLDLPTLDRAVEAGASFVVAPGFNPVVVDRCLQLGIPVIPGVSTPTDIEAALGRGLRLLKFFPAEASGGLEFLTAVAAPYQGISFMPTGGITPANLPLYRSQPFVAACGGSWIASEAAISGGRFDEITAAAAQAVELAAVATATP